MPVTSLQDLEPKNDQVLASDGQFHDPDEVEVDDLHDQGEDPFRSDPDLFESDENPHTELEGEEEVDVQPDAPRVPRTGDVNPEPENDVQDALNRVTKTVDALNSEASDKYSLGYDPTFYRQTNSIGLSEVFLRRVEEAVGIDVGQAQFRVYTNKRGTMTDWEYAQLLNYIAPREIVTGL